MAATTAATTASVDPVASFNDSLRSLLNILGELAPHDADIEKSRRRCSLAMNANFHVAIDTLKDIFIDEKYNKRLREFNIQMRNTLKSPDAKKPILTLTKEDEGLVSQEWKYLLPTIMDVINNRAPVVKMMEAGATLSTMCRCCFTYEVRLRREALAKKSQ